LAEGHIHANVLGRVEYGLRPKLAWWFRFPGVSPQATMMLAFGQTAGNKEKRNFKTHASGYQNARRKTTIWEVVERLWFPPKAASCVCSARKQKGLFCRKAH
jgi:hypothetical protein